MTFNLGIPALCCTTWLTVERPYAPHICPAVWISYRNVMKHYINGYLVPCIVGSSPANLVQIILCTVRSPVVASLTTMGFFSGLRPPSDNLVDRGFLSSPDAHPTAITKSADYPWLILLQDSLVRVHHEFGSRARCSSVRQPSFRPLYHGKSAMTRCTF